MLGLSDTRTIMHLQRFFMSNNDLDPKIYQTTKIIDLAPQGIIKITAKQDELNHKLDNTELHICNYYNNNGESKVKPSEPYYDYISRSEIICMLVNSNGELEADPAVYGPVLLKKLQIGISSYFQVKFPKNHGKPFWDINLLQDENYSDEKNLYCKKLIKISDYDDTTISIKLSKAESLLGKHFILSVCDENGEHCSSIELEVATDTT